LKKADASIEKAALTARVDASPSDLMVFFRSLWTLPFCSLACFCQLSIAQSQGGIPAEKLFAF
jgi:hypothetical protein